MSELQLQELDNTAELAPSDEVIAAEFAELVTGIDEAFDALPQEAKEQVVTRHAGEKRLWTADSQNNFGSEA